MFIGNIVLFCIGFYNVHWEESDSDYINAFLDSNWDGFPDDSHSTRGFGIYVRLNLISWTACEQHIISRSSTESEYKALADTIAELLNWLKVHLFELGVLAKHTPRQSTSHLPLCQSSVPCMY